MQRMITVTADGSHTITLPEIQVSYHSRHGAVQESMHVFIAAALQPVIANTDGANEIRILEIGFGTGLNALLSLRAASEHHRKLHYISIEKFPLSENEISLINHGALLNSEDAFKQIHAAPWHIQTAITDNFSLLKLQADLPADIPVAPVDIIFFDAFAPDVQPGLWELPFFEQLYHLLLPGGWLTTYCSKSTVRRTLATAGFVVEKIPGPYGKREMVRARKPLP